MKNKEEMKKFIIKHFKHEAMQFKFMRKWMGGDYFKIQPNLPMGPFWSDIIITNCQSVVTKRESYPTN